MPMPPPPMTALTITGNPNPAATASSAAVNGPAAGRTGNPVSPNVRRAATFSPASSRTSGDGPTHARPASITARANIGFSARNP
jgi:hypothetical protein